MLLDSLALVFLGAGLSAEGIWKSIHKCALGSLGALGGMAPKKWHIFCMAERRTYVLPTPLQYYPLE